MFVSYSKSAIILIEVFPSGMCTVIISIKCKSQCYYVVFAASNHAHLDKYVILRNSCVLCVNNSLDQYIIIILSLCISYKHGISNFRK